MKIGVLAFQGDFAKHIQALTLLGVEAVEVRTQKDLESCAGLIIPGGESTVMLKSIDNANMRQPLLKFAKQKPVFGTCAGLILMAKEVINSSLKTLQLLDISVERNAYGRQADSFQCDLSIKLKAESSQTVPAFFIRAPKIIEHSHEVKVLGEYEGSPVLIAQGLHLGATFHPELTDNLQIHQYFIDSLR